MSRVFFFGLLPTLLNISGGGYGGSGSSLFFFKYMCGLSLASSGPQN